MHKVSVMSIHTEANTDSVDWVKNVFVNELVLPHVTQSTRSGHKLFTDPLKCNDYQIMLHCGNEKG